MDASPPTASANNERASKRSFGSAVFISAASNVVILVLGLGTAGLLARALGPSGRGSFAAIVAWGGFLGGVAAAGLPSAAVYFGAKSNTPRNCMVTALLVALAPATLLGGVASLTLQRLHWPTDASATATSIYVALYAIANVFLYVPLGIMQGQQRFRSWNSARLAQPLIWSAVLLVLALWGAQDPKALAVGQACTFVAAAPIALALAWARAGNTRVQVDTAAIAPMLRYGGARVITSLPQTANRRIDQMVLAAAAEPSVLGFYVVAYNVSSLLSIVASPIAQVLLPHIALAPSIAERRARLVRTARLTVLTCMALAVALAIVTPVAIYVLFGSEFAPAVPAALVLVCASAVLALATALEESLLGMGMTRPVAIAETAGLMATVIGLAATVRTVPLAGAAITSLASYLVVLAVVALYCARAVDCRLRDLLIPTREDVTSLMHAAQKQLSALMRRRGSTAGNPFL